MNTKQNVEYIQIFESRINTFILSKNAQSRICKRLQKISLLVIPEYLSIEESRYLAYIKSLLQVSLLSTKTKKMPIYS